MSLTSWFREYLYIPLGGNRRGPGRKILNTMIVFICTGIWHGANFTFLIWGILHGVFMCIETIVTKDKKDAGKHFNALAYIYTMLVVIIGFVIFRADSFIYRKNVLIYVTFFIIYGIYGISDPCIYCYSNSRHYCLYPGCAIYISSRKGQKTMDIS